jgi:hypothetical protein
MTESQVKQMHDELSAVARSILEKYGMDLIPSSLTYTRKVDRSGIEGFRVQIKGIARVTVETAKTAHSDQHLRVGLAGPNTKAWVTDRPGNRREVIITEVKRTKYAFYFADDPNRRQMLGQFHLFSTTK